MTPIAPPPRGRTVAAPSRPAPASRPALPRYGHFANGAAAALATLGAAWRVELTPSARALIARLVGPREHGLQAAFVGWLEASCDEGTLTALRATARELASSRLALIRARGRTTFDVVQEVAAPLWPDLLAAWAGVPEQDRRRLHHLGRAMQTLAEPGTLGPRRLAGLVAALDELRRIFGQAYRHPRYTRSLPNLFASLETAWAPHVGPIADETTAAAVYLLLTGGRTARELTGPATRRLFSQPASVARLRAAPASASAFVADFEAALERRRVPVLAAWVSQPGEFASLSRPLSRILATAVVEALIDSNEPFSLVGPRARASALAHAAAPLDHLALRAGR